DEKHGPASFAATAYATPLAEGATPITNPNAPVGGLQPQTNPGSQVGGGLPQSGVGPTAAAGVPQASSGPIGRTIHGRYKIKRLIGEGGMGGVYEGEHLEIGKRVAIKLVHALHARDPMIAARIKQEARSTGAIESENIVQVFDAGEDPELGIFLVMELLKGEDLTSLLARKKRISPMAAATMVLQAAQGLSRAHAAGIVHRDLKPANIFMCTRDDGSSLVKLVDFGIAKLIRDANATQAQGLTRMGMVIGTPQYMSPEQAQGLLTVDHRTDIYSLGAVLFEAMVGRSPYQEMPTYEQTILQIMTRPPPRLITEIPDIHPELDRLCADMMAHDPNARPRDMAQVRERLLRIFPEIEGGRMPMRSLTNEAGFDATVAADAAGPVRAQLDAALVRAGLSGVGLAAPRPAQPATAPSFLAQTVTDEPIDDVAGVPQQGKKSGLLIAVVAILALVTGIGVVAIAKMHGAAPAQPPAGSFGLVQSTTVSAPVATATAMAPVAPAPTAVALQPLATSPAAAQTKPAPPSAHAEHSAKQPAPAKGAVAAAPAPAAPAEKPQAAPAEKPQKDQPAAARPVGGVGESESF
ncbi:MAG: protein kinase domain-containing protein, partial [Polyangiaceae bacterium]